MSQSCGLHEDRQVLLGKPISAKPELFLCPIYVLVMPSSSVLGPQHSTARRSSNNGAVFPPGHPHTPGRSCRLSAVFTASCWGAAPFLLQLPHARNYCLFWYLVMRCLRADYPGLPSSRHQPTPILTFIRTNSIISKSRGAFGGITVSRSAQFGVGSSTADKNELFLLMLNSSQKAAARQPRAKRKKDRPPQAPASFVSAALDNMQHDARDPIK